MKKTFYLTTPLYYANARPHVGSAYSTIVCDTIARYKKLCGYDVAFLTGTDEYGENIERAAGESGLSPQQHVDRYSKVFQDLWKLLGIEYTHFIRTSSPEHIRSVQKMIRRAQAADYIYKGKYQGRYCVYDNLYVSDSTDPIDCPTCGRPAELKDEENYFFRLSKFQDRLLELYEKNPQFVRPDFRMNEVKSFVKNGLRDISVSRRTLKWGVPWPDDPEHVVYVWYDALTGYLTGIGFADGQDGNAEFRKLWPADLHMMAKEIIRFHAVYWPAFLMAANLPLPGAVFAHGWLLFEQDKMSKSKGNVVYSEPIVEVLGSDALRYYLLRDMTFGQDSSFSYDGLIQRFNSDLANDLGNLITRTLTMVNSYFDGEVPARSGGVDDEAAHSLFVRRNFVLENVPNHFERLDFSRGLHELWSFITTVNQYLTERQPWVMAGVSTEREQLANVLHNAADALRIVAVLTSPVLPQSSQRLWEQLGQKGKVDEPWLSRPGWDKFPGATRITKPQPIFPRLDKTETLTKLLALEEKDRTQAGSGKATTKKETTNKVESEPKQKTLTEVSPTPNPEPQAPGSPAQPEAAKITIDDFTKIEMRVGEVLSAEAIPGATKLLKVMVDIGTEVRQVCAGIAEHYQPEQLVGMKVVLVTNLQPRKMRGVESNGMIVAASVGEGGKPVLATFKEDVPKGARLK